MLLALHKVIFMEKEAVLLCATMQDAQGHIQLQSSV